MELSRFLLPKTEVSYLLSSDSMHDALEQLENHYYTALPIVDLEGKYVGTLSEGDLLWKLKNTPDLDFNDLRQVPVSKIEKHIHNESVSIHAQMEDMLSLAADQNFVPVVDENSIFIGIIRRKDIIDYYKSNITD